MRYLTISIIFILLSCGNTTDNKESLEGTYNTTLVLENDTLFFICAIGENRLKSQFENYPISYKISNFLNYGSQYDIEVNLIEEIYFMEGSRNSSLYTTELISGYGKLDSLKQ